MKNDNLMGQWIGASLGRLRSVGESPRVNVDTVWMASGERVSSVTIVRWREGADAPPQFARRFSRLAMPATSSRGSTGLATCI
jgi:hypothetical protein